jgi:oligopeptide transport system substrate-binding protein
MKKKLLNIVIYTLVSLLILLVPLNLGCNPGTNGGSNSSDTLNLTELEPITLDPAISGESTSHLYISQIFSGLVRLDENLEVKPDIAEKWTMSQDGKTYIFKLRKNVTFHNGKEVTAQDFKYSWERACNPSTGSDTASIYLNDIVGADDVLSGRATDLKGVEALDKYTLKVTIDEPRAYFLSKLTYQTAFVVDKENVESNIEWWKKPNGTGPFILEKWVPGDTITLVANNNYYGDPVKLKQINFHILAGYYTDLYETGSIDVAPISEASIDKAADPEGPFHQDLYLFPQSSLTYLMFNSSKAPFDDVNIRKAFCYAVDKDKIINVILRNMVTNANGIIPPGIPGYSSDLVSTGYNVEKAKELIASSKYGNVANLPPIVITAAGYGGGLYREMGAIIQDWQDNLGVQVTVRQLEPEIFNYDLNKEVDNIYIYGWVADYPDPQDFLDTLFHTGSTNNIGNYSNKEVDNLLDQAGKETDEDKRLSLYREAEQIILADAPCLPLWFDINYLLIKPYVKDYKLDALGMPSLTKAYIER